MHHPSNGAPRPRPKPTYVPVPPCALLTSHPPSPTPYHFSTTPPSPESLPLSARAVAAAILLAGASAQPEPPDRRAATIENLPNAFTFAPGPPKTRDPVAAAILLRSPLNFPPGVGPNPTQSNGIPAFSCTNSPGGITLSPDSVDEPIRDQLSPIPPGFEFWFTFTTIDEYTTVQFKTSNIEEFPEYYDATRRVRPILAVYEDRGARALKPTRARVALLLATSLLP